MSKNTKNIDKKESAKDKGKLAEMNEDSSVSKEKSETGNAKDKGTLGKMNDEAEKE